METVTQRRAPAGEIKKPAGAVNSVFDTGASPAKPKRTYTPLDATNVEIRKNVPLPPVATRAPGGGAKALLDRMGAGDMVELPTRQARGVMSTAKKLGVKCAIRKLSDDTSGIWRL